LTVSSINSSVKASFIFDDTVACHVDASNLEGLLDACADSFERELALSSCRRFNNISIVSQAEQFSVSD
jgi:hypothetical protein